MHRRSRSALAGVVAAIVLLTSAIALAAPVGSSGVIGGFEIDGNLTFDHMAGASWDW